MVVGRPGGSGGGKGSVVDLSLNEFGCKEIDGQKARIRPNKRTWWENRKQVVLYRREWENALQMRSYYVWRRTKHGASRLSLYTCIAGN